MTYIPRFKPGQGLGKKDPVTGMWHKELTQCPFGERDLAGGEECYYGGGVGRCRWFVTYDFDRHYDHIACKHPPIRTERQIEFEF